MGKEARGEMSCVSLLSLNSTNPFGDADAFRRDNMKAKVQRCVLDSPLGLGNLET